MKEPNNNREPTGEPLNWMRTLNWKKILEGVLTGLLLAAVLAGIAWAAGAFDRHDGDPLDITVETDPDQLGNGSQPLDAAYLFRTTLGELPPPPGGRESCSDRDAWADQHDALDAGITVARLTISSSVDEAVSWNAPEVNVLERRSPPKGITATCFGGGGGPGDIDSWSIDLNRKEPRVQVFLPGDTEPAPSVGYTLDPDETRQFDLIATTDNCWCTWEIVLPLTVGGDKSTVTFDDHGEPFETAAMANAPSAVYQDGRWTTQGP
jgi:hypothetical protein